MKSSYSWLKEFVDFPHSPDEIAELVTSLGMEVEGITEIGPQWTNVVVGKVLTCAPIPETDHLSHCTVDAGTGETLSIVCGAPNVAAGQIVPVAVVGATLGKDFTITKRKMRGVLSQGMICSERELGISDEASGIMILQHDWKIGTPLEDYIGQRDWIFDFEVTINRGDCLSHLGVAREISAGTGIPLKMPTFELYEEVELTSKWVTVDIQSPVKCPRYAARMIKGIKIAPSPMWMQERLKSVGVRPINNVVDITNYILMELGQPLHAFDFNLVADGGIIVRTASEGEKFVTLDGKEHLLSSSDLLIADKNKGIALAGVMGGLNTEIKDDSQDVLLECAYFDPAGTRVTSRDRGIRTESSARFERGVDIQAIPYVMDRAANLMRQLAGGKVLNGMVDNYPKPFRKRKIDVRPTRVNKLLGIRIQAYKMENYLRGLGCEVEREDEKVIHVTPPSWRHDLEREIDCVEEVTRIHGYDRIGQSEVSQVPLTPNLVREQERRLIARIKRSMIELGFYEAITYSLIPLADIDRYGDWKALISGDVSAARLINPMSEDMAYLRPTLVIPLLRSVEKNIRSGVVNIRLFEWGKCFYRCNGKICENNRLSAVICGSSRQDTWGETNRLIDIYDIKGLAEQFIQRLSLDKTRIIYYDITGFLKYGAKIVMEDNDRILGWFGLLNPEITTAFGIDVPVYAFEMSGDLLIAHGGQIPRYSSLARYPAVNRDLAFIVDESTHAGDLENIIKLQGGNNLESVELFDVYSGKGIETGKKSLAYHIKYRNPDRTLADVEVDGYIDTIVSAAQKEINAVLRASV